MSKITMLCSCGCGNIISRPEREVNESKTKLFFFKRHSGDFYKRIGLYKGKYRDAPLKIVFEIIPVKENNYDKMPIL
jgi:hypothetical protein